MDISLEDNSYVRHTIACTLFDCDCLYLHIVLYGLFFTDNYYN